MWNTVCQNCWTIQNVWPGTRLVQCIRCRRVNPVPIPRSLQAPSPTINLWPPHSPKRAVIVGISYKLMPYKLQGSIHDAESMRLLLMHRFGFPDSSIWMLTEGESDPNKIPTKQNIMRALWWIVQGCRPGDSLVFHFSGHGWKQINTKGDEIDHFDETILPVDFMTQGMIVDDDINATIIQPLPYGVKLHAIIDACYSGTALDLPFVCRMNDTGQFAWEDQRQRFGAWKGTNGGEAISFSACDDNQASGEIKALSNFSTGIMTHSFVEAINNGHGATYGSIMNYLKLRVNTANSRWRQDPQLTSNVPFDIYRKPFSL